jgi:hypothetical protein
LNENLSLIAHLSLIKFLLLIVLVSTRLQDFNINSVFLTFLDNRTAYLQNARMNHPNRSSSRIYYGTFVQVDDWVVASNQTIVKITDRSRVQRYNPYEIWLEFNFGFIRASLFLLWINRLSIHYEAAIFYVYVFLKVLWLTTNSLCFNERIFFFLNLSRIFYA